MATSVRRRIAFVAGVVAVQLSLSGIALAQEVIRISGYRAKFGRNAEISKVARFTEPKSTSPILPSGRNR